MVDYERMLRLPTSEPLYAKLVYLAVFLMQFQNVSIGVFGSRFDASCFVLLFCVLLLLTSTPIKLVCLMIILFFVALQLLIWSYFQIAPVHRLLSGLVWFGGLVMIALLSEKGYYSRLKVFHICNISITGLAFVLIFQKFFLGSGRPSGFMDEPSYAGLLVFGWAFVILVRMLDNSKFGISIGIINVLSFASLILAGVITGSMHIVVFIMLFGVYFFMLHGISGPNYLVGMIALSLCALLFYLVADPSHYYSRIVVSEETTNLSLLSWLRGGEQALHVVKSLSLFGFGLGSTGYFSFDSQYGSMLEVLGYGHLNLTDAYSGLFRLVIEIGLIPTLLFLIWFLRSFPLVIKNTSTGQRSAAQNYSKYLFVFGFFLILGSLLKEPSYSRSYVYIGIFLVLSNFYLVRRPL